MIIVYQLKLIFLAVLNVYMTLMFSIDFIMKYSSLWRRQSQGSQHNPAQKKNWAENLVHRTRMVLDQENVGAELRHLETILKKNGYSQQG